MRARAKKESQEGYETRRANAQARRHQERGVRINVPPRRDPGCTACSSRASKRARPYAWSWCRRSHWRCPGGACATCAWRCGPTSRHHPERDRGKRERASERHGNARQEPKIVSRDIGKTSCGTSWLVRAPRHTQRRRDFASSSRRESDKGKVRGGLADTRRDARAEGVRRTRPARWVFSRKLLSSVDMSLRLSEAFSLRIEARYGGGQSSFVRFPRSPNRTRVRFSSRQGALRIARDR